ncbi:MAG TPA: 23S rRNA pseudouridine(1911/1915/1917) synthase RluD [Aeromonadales bacterium]|nr:23S rRNA pseudouridine(1911/1915/1917) synthase RluD [Aeromonadales bacterium]
MNKEKIKLQAEAPMDVAKKRFDVVLSEMFPDYSRSRLQQWLKQGNITINGDVQKKPRFSLAGGELIQVDAEIEAAGQWQPQSLPLNITYEDTDLIVVNKQAGLVVHPGTGNSDKTLVNGLLHRYPELEGLPRAGIIHRLDKNTTGLLVVARNLKAHHHLTTQLQQRAFAREYQALVSGKMIVGGTVDAPIGRHPHQRIKMAVVASGKEAITQYQLKQKFRAHSLLEVKLETGRTHQIRVHMKHIGHTLVGDQVYGGRLMIPAGAGEALTNALRHFKRQALHARKLGLIHPSTHEWIEWEADLPDDFKQLLEIMEQDIGAKH